MSMSARPCVVSGTAGWLALLVRKNGWKTARPGMAHHAVYDKFPISSPVSEC